MKNEDLLNEIIDVMKQFGGQIHFNELYQEIINRNKYNLETFSDPTSIIRTTIYRHSSDCDMFTHKEDIFFSIDGKGKGVWGLRNFTPNPNNIPLTTDDIGFPEGRKKLRQHLYRERNPLVIKLAKERYKEKYGSLKCEVCDFDFKAKYGEIGEDFIEGHHIKPVSELKDGETTKVEDILLVCSNCHSMLHRKRPWLTKDKLKTLIKENEQ